MALESYGSFEELKSRLDEIVEAVNDKDLPLDQALSLYEEAVGLGLRASDLLEQGIDEASVQEALASEAPAGLADDSAQPAVICGGGAQGRSSGRRRGAARPGRRFRLGRARRSDGMTKGKAQHER